MTDPHYILTLRCRDVAGISAAVSSALAGSGAFITESSQFGDDSGSFFMRTVFSTPGLPATTTATLRAALAPVEKRFEMDMALHDRSRPMRVMLAVSKHGHCLNHLLHRWHSDELPIEVVGVISNHEDMRKLVEWYGLPYHHPPT
jgi:formyltetrahydrofolate deformylase